MSGVSDIARLASHTVGDDGPRVVFLHGLFGQGKNWHTIALRLAERGFRVTTVDLPNHGRSPWTEHQGYEEMAELVAQLLVELGEPVTLVGHSMGGKVAMTVALRRPELLIALVVVDIAPVDYGGASSEFEEFIAGMQALDLSALGSRTEADEALAEAVPNRTIRGFLLQSLVRDAEQGWRWRLNLDVLQRELDRLGGFPRFDDGVVFEGPVLWIAGADSPYVAAKHRAQMTALFPRARLVRIKDAGHWVHSEQPAVFLSALEQFLS
ncbi:MAG: alpha/beta fold hydrolase [Mycobacteriaceae bacterium]